MQALRGFVRKKNPIFLEPYLTRGGMERELKNERGFRERKKFVLAESFSGWSFPGIFTGC
jgi:hypothetical protein